MKIVIIGCGKVGTSIARELNTSGHDISVVDNNRAAVRRLSETLDVLDLDNNCQRTDGGQSVCRSDSKAFRFVYIEMTDGARCDDVTMDFEYAPFEEAKSGLFRCSDDEMNRIWLVSAYTLELTTRDVHQPRADRGN